MAINYKVTVENYSKIGIKSNNEGLIPAFGVYINQLPTEFWNIFTMKILKAAGDDLYSDASGLLEYAAAECGYNTAYGILNSEEFQAISQPMMTNPREDALQSLVAVVSAWGWGKARIVELVPAELLIIHVYDYYESDIKERFNPEKPNALMLRGVFRAFMDIVYGENYPFGFNTYKCLQTKGIETGDFYGEFIVTRN